MSWKDSKLYRIWKHRYTNYALEIAQLLLFAFFIFKAQVGVQALESGGCMYYYETQVPGVDNSSTVSFYTDSEEYQKEYEQLYGASVNLSGNPENYSFLKNYSSKQGSSR